MLDVHPQPLQLCEGVLIWLWQEPLLPDSVVQGSKEFRAQILATLNDEMLRVLGVAVEKEVNQLGCICGRCDACTPLFRLFQELLLNSVSTSAQVRCVEGVSGSLMAKLRVGGDDGHCSALGRPRGAGKRGVRGAKTAEPMWNARR